MTGLRDDCTLHTVMPPTAPKTWDRSWIASEVARLAPWYYAWDLHGVRTDETPPCDDTGHRRITFPRVRPGFWEGATVLDVGCAEGAWSFGASAAGAGSVLAFDCRVSHLEKAQFLRRVLGHESVEFELGSCERWIEANAHRRFDHVLFCGIVYHLPQPWATLPRYCAIAERSILVSTPLWGGPDDGYTLWQESDNIAASEDVLDSCMPNTLATLVGTAASAGFVPTHVQVTGHGQFRGGCAVLFERNRGTFRRARAEGGLDSAFDVWLGRQGDELSLCLLGKRPIAWRANAALTVRAPGGGSVEVKAAEEVQFPRLVAEHEVVAASDSCDYRIPLPAALAKAPELRVQLELRDAAAGAGGAGATFAAEFVWTGAPAT